MEVMNSSDEYLNRPLPQDSIALKLYARHAVNAMKDGYMD
jgi:hypothetical protein